MTQESADRLDDHDCLVAANQDLQRQLDRANAVIAELQPDRVVASRVLDRSRVADAVQRGVRLDIDPVYAKAALRGMPVEFTHQQAMDVADVTLEALAKTHPGAKSWLIDANKDLRSRNDADNAYWRIQLARQRRTTDTWRGAAVNGWVWMVAWGGLWQWHWSRWIVASVLVAGTAMGIAYRSWLMRRDQRKAGDR